MTSLEVDEKAANLKSFKSSDLKSSFQDLYVWTSLFLSPSLNLSSFAQACL